MLWKSLCLNLSQILLTKIKEIQLNLDLQITKRFREEIKLNLLRSNFSHKKHKLFRFERVTAYHCKNFSFHRIYQWSKKQRKLPYEMSLCWVKKQNIPKILFLLNGIKETSWLQIILKEISFKTYIKTIYKAWKIYQIYLEAKISG